VTADHLIVLGRGRIIADAPMSTILAQATGASVLLKSPQASQLAQLLTGPDIAITSTDRETLSVSGLTAVQIGEAAAHAGIVLHELTPGNASLEQAYMELTKDDVEYQAASTLQHAGAGIEGAHK